VGVLTFISLEEANRLFASYDFTKLTPTTSGVMDTTYIAQTKERSYILKKYERDIKDKISQDIKLLKKLNEANLNVPLHLDSNGSWHIYTKLEGKEPKNIKSYHIQAIARFLAKLHKESLDIRCNLKCVEVKEALNYTKKNFFFYYKKFEFLKSFKDESSYLIHADIFKDNTIFEGARVGVIDFIDSCCGSFTFDVAVALVGFDVRQKDEYSLNIFLVAYNQHAPKKINKEDVKKMMRVASHFYALKRVEKYKNIFKAKELLR